MRVSQLLCVMDKDDWISIDDYERSVDDLNLYVGTVRGITRESPLNKMHVHAIYVGSDDMLHVLAENPKAKKGGE